MLLSHLSLLLPLHSPILSKYFHGEARRVFLISRSVRSLSPSQSFNPFSSWILELVLDCEEKSIYLCLFFSGKGRGTWARRFWKERSHRIGWLLTRQQTMTILWLASILRRWRSFSSLEVTRSFWRSGFLCCIWYCFYSSFVDFEFGIACLLLHNFAKLPD